ncbi:AsmA-like C-terminal domain-containing protein [Lacibacterium aquatile]|uniref:AsmA-like C-terminal domain-containing protein n=1 Tax=Lacibacterium aquatile TaxID=1168082 RepID=A0ABW5DK18_9PROT
MLQTVFALTILVVVGVGAAVWRLAQGPWALDQFLPVIENALSSAAAGQKVQLTGVELIWDAETRAIGLHARGLRVLEGEKVILAAPRLALFVDAAKLAAGRLSPTEVRIDDLSLRVQRNADGNYSMAFLGATQNQPGDTSAVAPPPQAGVDHGPREFILRTLGPKRKGGATSDLSGIRLRNASLILDDQVEGLNLKVPDVDLWLHRDAEGLVTGRIGAQVEVAPHTLAPISANFRLLFNDPDKPDDDLLTLDATAGPVKPAQLARLWPSLNAVSGLDVPAQIRVTAEVGGLEKLNKATVEAKLEAGPVHHALLPQGFLPVESGIIRAQFDKAADAVRIEEARLLLTDGIEAQVTGQASVSEPQKGNLTARLLNVPVDSLPTYWPASVGPNARKWVLTNLTKGKVPMAEAKLGFSHGGDGALVIDSLTAALGVEGLQVAYLGKLPPVQGVAGAVTYDHASGKLGVTTTGGTVTGTKITAGAGQIEIGGLNQPDQTIKIDLPLKGPVSDILAAIDQQPLGFAKKLGVLPSSAAGEADGRLKISFPLFNDVKIEQIALSVEAVARDGALPGISKGFDLSEADLKLKIDTKSLVASGTGKVNGVPMTLAVTEPFQARTYRSLKATGIIDDAGRTALRLPGEGRVFGPVGATLDYQEAPGGIARLTGTLDFAAARATVDEFQWEKPAGSIATGRYDLTLQNGDLKDLSLFEVNGDKLTAKLSARFNASGDLSQVDISQLKVPGNDVGGLFIRQGKGWNATVRGTRLSLIGYQAQSKIEAKKNAGQPKTDPMPLTLNATLGAVELVPGREIRNLSLKLRTEGHVWREFDARGLVGEKAFFAAIGTSPAGNRAVQAQVADLGGLLMAVDMTDKVIGGSATFEGEFKPGTSGVTGSLQVSTYRLRDVPVLARLLAIVSITGIPEMLGGEGLPFNSTEAKLRIDEKTIEISEAYSSGLSIGLTVKGSVNRDAETLDLMGEVVPLAGVNRVIGSIPILGDILTGGKGGGIFAWTWRGTGTIENPDVSVNPISFLAPGILRRLFQGGGEAAPPPEQTPSNK